LRLLDSSGWGVWAWDGSTDFRDVSTGVDGVDGPETVALSFI
jgi:hypothetical protein